MKSEVVCTGIPFGEGPVWCDNQTLVVTSVAAGALYRVWPNEHRATHLVDTGGGANGAALATDGSLLVTQNGGMDFAKLGIEMLADFEGAPPVTPGLQLVRPDGDVTYLASDGLHAPNDVAVAADGRVFFTDPGHFPPPTDDFGRVIVYERDGTISTFASSFWFCNGIAFDRDDNVVVVERQGLQRVFPDGTREWIIEKLGRGAGDGFCLDADGRFHVASTIEHGIRVVDPDGSIVEFLEIEGEGLSTNCCFGGRDLRTLFVTDALPGNVVAFEGLPTAGLPLHAWPGP
jgi:gluconolactonase